MLPKGWICGEDWLLRWIRKTGASPRYEATGGIEGTHQAKGVAASSCKVEAKRNSAAWRNLDLAATNSILEEPHWEDASVGCTRGKQ